MDDGRHRLDDLDEEIDDDGTRGIWATFDNERAERPADQGVVNVDTLKERLKRRARLRARRTGDEVEEARLG